MIKQSSIYGGAFAILFYLNSGFVGVQENTTTEPLEDYNEAKEVFQAIKTRPFSYFIAPSSNVYFNEFQNLLAERESSNNYEKVNSLGYLGKYQFGKTTLKSIGVNQFDTFLKSPILQEKALLALLSKNKWLLRHVITKHQGSKLDDVVITESGILAAAHLAGASSVKKFFEQGKVRFFRDAYGTSLRTYLKALSGYDTSHIIADKDANVNEI